VPRGSSAPGEPIGSGFSALIFFGSFLYQDKKEHKKWLFTKILPSRCKVSAWLFGKATTCLANTFSPGPSFQTYSGPSGLVKIVRSIQGAAPLAIYSAPSGLKPPDKF